MTTIDDIDAPLRTMVVEALDLDIAPAQITADTNLFDLGIDSLAVLRLLMAVQEKFGIEIPEADLNATMFERFGNLVDVVAAAR